MDNTLCTTYTIIIPVPVLELNQLLKAVNGSDQINLFESFFLGGGERASNNSVRRSFIILVCSFGSGGMQMQWESCKPFSPLFPPPLPPLTFRLVLIVTPYCTSAVYITCNVDLENIVMNQIVSSG